MPSSRCKQGYSILICERQPVPIVDMLSIDTRSVMKYVAWIEDVDWYEVRG